MKAVFIDTETTGLYPSRHAMIQIAAVFGEIKEGVFQEESHFYSLIAPHKDAQIDQRALEVNGLKAEDLKDYPKPDEVYRKFVKLLEGQVDKYNKEDKLHFLAYNARFDMDFLRAFFSNQGDKYFGSWFWFPPIDVMNLLAFEGMRKRHKLADFKLATVAQACGLTPEGELHDALADIRLTIRLFNLISERRIQRAIEGSA